ncbi:MAG: hypothetical protein GY710_17615 [Desulfobacteraceae bacterium]|nr:hypothetical protein [Desulfobacteraceae bacterium]
MQDIHNIKSPVMVGLDPGFIKMILLIAGGFSCLVLGIFLIKRFWKFKSKQPQTKLIQAILPYEAALGELDCLCRKTVIDPRAFYFDLGGLVKRYVGGSYSMNAVEMTTQELVRQIRLTGMNTVLIMEVSQFLNISDPFRYGPVVPDSSQVKKDLVSVRQLIMGMEEDLESKRCKQEAP